MFSDTQAYNFPSDRVSVVAAQRFLWIGLAILTVDVLIFEVLFELGVSLVMALTTSFVVASIFGYLVCSRHLAGGGQRAIGELAWSELARFIFICLLGFGLRGGVIADAMRLFGWSALVSVFLGATVATVVGYLGNLFFVFRISDHVVSFAARWRMAAIGAVAYMLALRLAFLGLVNLLPEEAYYWNFSQHPDIGYLDHPPMSAWLIWLGTAIFGNTEFGVRIGAYIAWIIICLFVYRLTVNLFDKSAAVVGLVLTAVLPVFFYTGFMMTPDVPLMVTWAGALFFLERALIAQRQQAWWGVGICAGLGMVSKYTIALLGPAALIFLIVDPQARRWLRRPDPYIAATLAVLLFSPVIYWNAMHGWASFAFQSTHRLQEARSFSTPDLIVSVAVLLTPPGLMSVIAIFVSRRIRVSLAPADNVEARRRWLFMIVFTATPLCVFLAFSFAHQVKFDWTAPLWLAILPAISAMIIRAATRLSRYDSVIRKLWEPVLLGTVAIYAVFLHYLVLGLPFVGHFSNIRTLPIVWDELGRQAGLIKQAVDKETGQGSLIVGMDRYYVASEVAFYNRQSENAVQASVGGSALGNDSLMYGYWYKPSEMRGRPLVMLGVKSGDLEQDDLGRYFSRLTEIKSQTVSKDGMPIGQFFYRIGYGYRDCPLQQASCPAK